MSQWHFNPVGDYWLVAVIAVSLLAALKILGLPRSRLDRRKRWILVALRLAVVLIFLFALMRPTLVYTKAKKQSSTLVMVLDSSRSMSVPDAFGGKTRWEALKRTMADAAPLLADLRKDMELAVYAFDAEAHKLDFSKQGISLPRKPEGRQTALGAVLEDVLRREGGKRLAGVIVLSDGAQRAYAPRDVPPQMPARRLADLGFPLYALPLGQPTGLGQARDVALRDLTVNPSVFVKNELTAQGLAKIDGYAREQIAAELLFELQPGKMEAVASELISAGPQGQVQPITLSYVPQMPGEFKVTLRLAPQQGELVTTNNELSTFVTVLKGGVNVLYLEGELRVEQKFIRRALDASPDIKVDYLRLVERDPRGRPSLIDRFRPGKYDVYMLGDLDSSLLGPDELVALTNVIQQGAGLIMLGGFHSFGAGGYSQTPLSEILPVELDPLERQRLGEPLRKDLHIAGPITMVPARPLGIHHFVMALGAADNEAAWNGLPPLDGANRFSALKPTARILAQSSAGDPLLVAHEAGGRVMALATDTTWHWWMRGRQAEHKRCWRQVILWLARKEQTEGNVWVKLEQRRFAPGSRVEFTAGARGTDGQPVTNAEFKVEVRVPSTPSVPVGISRQGAEMSGAFAQTEAAGDYTIVVTASDKGKPLGTASVRFMVYDQDLELDNAAADPSLLESLAKVTEQAGGRSLAPEELPQLLREIKERPQESEVESQEKFTPWDTWPCMLAFIGLMSTEWYLRKRWGLV